MTGDRGTQAALLLTVSLGKADSEGAKPLSRGEWARLAGWLGDRGLDPSALLVSRSNNSYNLTGFPIRERSDATVGGDQADG